MRETIIIIIIINNLFNVGKKKKIYIANKLINANKIKFKTYFTTSQIDK